MLPPTYADCLGRVLSEVTPGEEWALEKSMLADFGVPFGTLEFADWLTKWKLRQLRHRGGRVWVGLQRYVA